MTNIKRSWSDVTLVAICVTEGAAGVAVGIPPCGHQSLPVRIAWLRYGDELQGDPSDADSGG